MKIMKDIFIAAISLIFLVGCEESSKNQQTTSNPVVESKERVFEDTSVKNNVSQESTPKTDTLKTQETQSTNSDLHSSADQQPIVLGNKSDNLNQDSVIEVKKEGADAHIAMSSFNVEKTDIVLGDKDSKVVVIEYFSPTCVHCASYHSNIFPEIKQKYIDTNKIAYVIREFIATKQDLDASILGRCKGDTESFMKFQNVILQQQDKWAYSSKYRELLTDIGQLGGVSAEDYKKCLSDDKIAETLMANTNLVAKMPKFMGTPALFVNGMPLDLGRNVIDNISVAVEKALK